MYLDRMLLSTAMSIYCIYCTDRLRCKEGSLNSLYMGRWIPVSSPGFSAEKPDLQSTQSRPLILSQYATFLKQILGCPIIEMHRRIATQLKPTPRSKRQLMATPICVKGYKKLCGLLSIWLSWLDSVIFLFTPFWCRTYKQGLTFSLRRTNIYTFNIDIYQVGLGISCSPTKDIYYVFTIVMSQ